MMTKVESRKNKKIEIIVMGASAGGIDALLMILKGLPPTYSLPIVIVVHLPEERESRLAEVFSHSVSIPVSEAMDKREIIKGNLYFAGAGYHLSIEEDHTFSVSCEAPVFYSRPSIDFLMESAAYAYGTRVAGILLTGANQDGAIGMAAIAKFGGLTIVQDPAEALVSTMPRAAIALQQPDMILRLQEIQHLMLQLEKN